MLSRILNLATVCCVVPLVSGCSGGGSNGSGGGSSTSNLIQSEKMSCAAQVCFGGGSLTAAVASAGEVRVKSVTNAVTLYDTFNQVLIPNFNKVITKIENGVAAGGADSCADIGIGFNGSVTISGVAYDAKTASSTLTYPSSPFSSGTMTKRLSARIGGGGSTILEADVDCGAGTDASPLVGRVISAEGSEQYNAWYERGSANHIRILMIAKHSGTVYAAWFKTDDGDQYEIILATGGAVYRGAGSRSAGKINFQDNGAGSATCLNAVTGAAESCAYTIPTVTSIPGALLTSGTPLAWSSVADSTPLLSPTY